MKYLLPAAFAALALAGCMGPEGNPNAMPYAGEDGGAIAVKPETVGTVSYDPNMPAAPFDDMRAGSAGLNPPPPMPAPQR